MGTKAQTILKHKNNRVDILHSNTTSFDTLEIIQEATSLFKTLPEVKQHLENFKKFSKTAKRAEGFVPTQKTPDEFDYIILVEDLGDNLFSISRIKYLEYKKFKKEIHAEYTASLIEENITDVNDRQIAKLQNGTLYMFSKNGEVVFIETDNMFHKKEDLSFLLDIYSKQNVFELSATNNGVLSYSA